MSDQSLAHGLHALNSLDAASLEERLVACCGSKTWVAAVAARRPFGSADELFRGAEEAADGLGREDWLAAFAHHPRIGDIGSLRRRFGKQSGAWSEGEQAGLAGTSEDVLERLAAGNQAYEERFGHVFLIFATGKSASEMLESLETRLPHDAGQELEIAAGEQRKITRLRLEKLLGELGGDAGKDAG